MNIRLIPIENGFLAAETEIMCEGGTGRSHFPVSCWVIEHPKGLVLFDTGMHQELASPGERLDGVSTYFDVTINDEHRLSKALENAGVDVAEIKFMVLSHLHFDHCGGTEQIPNATVIVQQAEWQAGHNPELIEIGIYTPSDYDLGHQVQQVEGEHDLFGDGSVMCVPTPGHTAGHQSLRVHLASGPVLLTADCAYWQSMLDDMKLPPFGFDQAMHLKSMGLLKEQQTLGCRLIFGHDTAQWDELKDTVLE